MAASGTVTTPADAVRGGRPGPAERNAVRAGQAGHAEADAVRPERDVVRPEPAARLAPEGVHTAPDTVRVGQAARTTRTAPLRAEQACPIGPVVDIVFSRWTTPILWTLNEYGRQRFVELQRLIGTITPKVLTQRLRQMERDGLVVRTYHPEVPPRVEYEITDLGRSLAPLFAALTEWSTANLPRVEQARLAFDDAPAGPGHRG